MSFFAFIKTKKQVTVFIPTTFFNDDDIEDAIDLINNAEHVFPKGPVVLLTATAEAFFDLNDWDKMSEIKLSW